MKLPKIQNNKELLDVVGSVIFVLVCGFFAEALRQYSEIIPSVVLLLLIYFLLSRKINILYENLKYLKIFYIDNEDILKNEFINAVWNAEEFIMAIGSKSKLTEYLKAIEYAVKNKDIEYWRGLFGKKMYKEMYEHIENICKLNKETIYIFYEPNYETPVYLLLTEKVALIGLPSPNHTTFRTCIKINDDEIIKQLSQYVRTWYNKKSTIKITDADDLNNLKQSVKIY
jgi:hypothetical protein